MELQHVSLVSFAAALGIGLLAGLERERKKGAGQDRRPAGLRTFAITAMLGHVCMLLGGIALLISAMLGVILLLTVAYWRSPQEDPGLTTEVSLLLVLVLGALAVYNPTLATGLGVVLTLLLAYREGLHHFALTQLSEQEVKDGLTLATAALVILPLVPDRYMGPYEAVNPRTIWLLSVLMMAISAIGHVTIRMVGPRFGLPLAGLVSGFASSTATLATMGMRARQNPSLLRTAAAGGIMSCIATMVQMGLVLVAIDLTTFRLLLPALCAAGLMAAAYGVWGALGSTADGKVAEPLTAGRAFDLRLSLAIGMTVAVVQLMSALFYQWFGNEGVLVSAAIGGFPDTHAAAASVVALVKAGKIPADAAVIPVLAALSTNTISKGVMTWLSGGNAYFIRVVPGLLLILATLWGIQLLT